MYNEAMLKELNAAIVKQLTKLSRQERTAVTGLILRYDDNEVTAQSNVTQMQFDCLGDTHVLNMSKLDNEELQNIKSILAKLDLKDDFNRRVDAIALGNVLSTRTVMVAKVITALDYYKDAFQTLLDFKEPINEN